MEDHHIEKSGRLSVHNARVVVITLATLLLVWFVGANTQTVQIHFWVFTADTSLIVVIVIAAALGAILALLLRRSKQHR